MSNSIKLIKFDRTLTSESAAEFLPYVRLVLSHYLAEMRHRFKRFMEVLQESYCSSDDDIDEEVHSKENILVMRIFGRHVGYSSFIIFSADQHTLQYRL